MSLVWKNVPTEDRICPSCGYDFSRGEMSSFYDQRQQKQAKSKIRHKNEMVIVATLRSLLAEAISLITSRSKPKLVKTSNRRLRPFQNRRLRIAAVLLQTVLARVLLNLVQQRQRKPLLNQSKQPRLLLRKPKVRRMLLSLPNQRRVRRSKLLNLHLQRQRRRVVLRLQRRSLP